MIPAPVFILASLLPVLALAVILLVMAALLMFSPSILTLLSELIFTATRLKTLKNYPWKSLMKKKILVIDSSVMVKWINSQNEDNLEKADQIRHDARLEKVELIAPELAKYEVGNVLLKGKQLTPQQAMTSLGTVYSLPLTYIPDSEELSQTSYSLAYKAGITYYDASFVSLANSLEASLVTANPKHQAVSGSVNVIPIQDFK